MYVYIYIYNHLHIYCVDISGQGEHGQNCADSSPRDLRFPPLAHVGRVEAEGFDRLNLCHDGQIWISNDKYGER